MVAKISSTTTTINHKTTTAAQNQKPTRTPRPPLLPSDPENNNALAQRRPKAREVTSRYMSSSSSSSRRSPSPSVSRTSQSTAMITPTSSTIKRSQSVERKRTAVTPKPNTLDLRNANGFGELTSAHKLLLTSTRSLSVSFQGESFSLQVSRAKPAPSPSTAVRKAVTTPERRKAATLSTNAENTKQVDQRQLWPGRSRQANLMSRSFDSTDDRGKLNGNVVRALKDSMIDSNSSFDGRLWTSNKDDSTKSSGTNCVSLTSDDAKSVSSSSSTSGGAPEFMPRVVVSSGFLQDTRNSNSGFKTMAPTKLTVPKKVWVDSPVSSPKGMVNSRGQLSPTCGPVTMATRSSPARGMSPSRVRNGMISGNLSNTPSILSFAVDVRREKVGEIRIANAHILRLLHNRLLQWRFVNARTDVTLSAQKLNAEKSLYNAWVTTSKLCESVRAKRSELQLLRHNLKLTSILKDQIIYLEEWALMDHDYCSSLLRATEALRASTLRLPVVAGARADVQKVKDAIGSAVDVIQAMASSICLLLSKVSGVNSLVAELANVVADEHALLAQNRDLLSTIAAMQVQECSSRTHILQMQ